MNFINPPGILPENITHKSFFSKLYNHEVGYNIIFTCRLITKIAAINTRSRIIFTDGRAMNRLNWRLWRRYTETGGLLPFSQTVLRLSRILKTYPLNVCLLMNLYRISNANTGRPRPVKADQSPDFRWAAEWRFI